MLLDADFRVRELVAECLELKASNSSCTPCKQAAAFELAFCYKIGFGVLLDDDKSQSWLKRSGRYPKELEVEMSNIPSFGYNNNTIVLLQSEGYSISIDHPNEYRIAGRHLREVELEYRREIADLQKTFGKDTR